MKKNNRFSISTPSYWTAEGGEELLNKLNELLELRSQNDNELHVKEVENWGTRIEIENRGYILAGFDIFKSELLAELKRVSYKDLENMFYRMPLFYDENVDILDVKYSAGSTNGYTIPTGIFEISDINLMVKSLLPHKVKVKITIDDIRLKSILTTNRTKKYTENSFLLYNFRFWSILFRSFT